MVNVTVTDSKKRYFNGIAAILAAVICLFAVSGCGNTESEITGDRDISCDAVFYGDSITAGNNFDEIFPDLKIVDCGLGGATIEDLTERVSLVGAHRPAKVFVMAGGNDLNSRNIDQCVELYRGLLDAIRKECPYAVIYVESMLPIDKAVGYFNDCTNPVIRSFNKSIKALAGEYGITYIDIYPAYEHGGGLDKKYSKDGIHLDPGAFGPWAEIVRPFLES